MRPILRMLFLGEIQMVEARLDVTIVMITYYIIIIFTV